MSEPDATKIHGWIEVTGAIDVGIISVKARNKRGFALLEIVAISPILLVAWQ